MKRFPLRPDKFVAAVAFVIANGAAVSPAAAQDWKSSVSTAAPGSFVPLRPLHAVYRFGWSGLTAATGDVRFARNGARSVLSAKMETIESVRALWPFDLDYNSIADATAFRPIEVKQTEITRKKRVVSDVAFDANGALAKRNETKADKPTTTQKRFEFAPLHDLQSALLYLRSQPLTNGSSYRVVVFPGKDPYLATVSVSGREHINVAAGSYNAIRADVQLSRIGKQMELKPHKKFKKATVWLSDDADRMLLRVEAEVFVGTIFAELQSIEFQGQPQLKRD